MKATEIKWQLVSDHLSLLRYHTELPWCKQAVCFKSFSILFLFLSLVTSYSFFISSGSNISCCYTVQCGVLCDIVTRDFSGLSYKMYYYLCVRGCRLSSNRCLWVCLCMPSTRAKFLRFATRKGKNGRNWNAVLSFWYNWDKHKRKSISYI